MKPWIQTKNAVLLALMALAAGLIWLSQQGCGHEVATAYRALADARAGIVAARDSLGEVCRIKRLDCIERHHAATPEYDACWAGCRKATEHWVKYARPSLNSAIVASLGAIQAAEAAKAKLKWTEIIKPVACAVANALSQWGHLLPENVRAPLAAIVALVSSASCPKEVT